ncbi:MAG: RDD family protein [Chitinophagales bacterium]
MNPYLLPFEDFFTYLQQQGFALGVDDFLQVQALLNRLPEDCSPERLKRLLCPLVASNQEEQTFFYQAFDRYFANIALHQETPPNRSTSPFETLESKSGEAIEGEQEEWSEEAHFQKYGDKTVFTFWGFITSRLTWIIAFLVVMAVLFFVGLGATSTFKQTSKPLIHTNPEPTEIPKKSPYGANRPFEEQPFEYGWLWWVALFAGGAFVLYRTYKAEEEDFYLDVKDQLKPPHYWNIRVPKSDLKFSRSSVFKQVSQQLQHRRKVPTSKMDIPKTLTATVASAGYPQFHYLQQSELPEYLMLLPQSKIKDQKLQLLEVWYEALKEQEVFVHRFFYHPNKPEWCLDETGNALHIKEVYAKFGACRLLVFANLNKWNEKDAATAMGFWEDWTSKALLNTNSPSKEMQDLAAKNDFLLFAANLESLTQLNDVFEGQGYAPSLEAAKRAASDWEALSIVETVKELKRRLNKASFRWLCATTLYPEMNWDLTVYIGQVLFDERELVKEENVLPLVDLPWFRKGAMPDGLRMALRAQLDKHSTFLVKDALLHLLQLNPLVGEEYSEEFFDYQLHIALEDAQLHPEDTYKLSTLQHLTEQTQFAESRYQQVVLRYLREQKEESGALKLGKQFQQKFQRKEIEVEGIITSKKKEKITYVYPAAPLLGRLASAFVDVIFSIFIFFMAACVGICLGVFLDNGMITGIFLAGLFTLWAYLGMDSWSEGTGFGKYSLYRVIDVRTNKPCSFWQSAVRRSFLPVFVGVLFVAGEFSFFDMEEELMMTPLLFYGLFFVYVAFVAIQPDSRKFTDLLAHTQVVREEDYQSGNFEVVSSFSKKQQATQKTAGKEMPKNGENYVYARANTQHRMKAAGVDVCMMIAIMIGMILFGAPLYTEILTSGWAGLWLFVILLSGLGFCANLDNWNKGTGLGKTTNLVVIDLNTNQQATWRQKILRRSIDFLMLFLGAAFLSFLGFTFSIFLYFVLLVFTANVLLVYIGQGRRLGDYVLGTQVVDLADFEAKNYEVAENQEITEKRGEMGQEMQNQFINSNPSINFPNPPQNYFL